MAGKTYYETKSLNIILVKFGRKFNFNTFPNKNQIFKLIKNFEVHGTCEDRKAMGSSPFGPPLTQEECTYVINNFARHFQHCLQRRTSGTCTLGHLLTILSFTFETRSLQILKG